VTTTGDQTIEAVGLGWPVSTADVSRETTRDVSRETDGLGWPE
jgi:hypothetical protein